MGISRKIKVAYNSLKDEGFLSLTIRSLQALQRRTLSNESSSANKTKVYTHARYDDVLKADFSTPHSYNKTPEDPTKMTFAWIMPPPGRGSGGHLNIFRFIGFLEKAGHKSIVYMYTYGEHGSVEGVRASMGDSYPDDVQALKDMRWLDPSDQIDGVDGIFATSWETAYASYNLNSDARRFYFVQDFEPYFYPVGGLFSLAENTYKMGFYGITAGGWLEKKLSTDYGMKVASFDFSVDKSLYKFTNHEKRKEIFYYARPYTERRGFEVGILALDIFHKKHPDYTINLVGWDVSQYDIPFPHKNLNILEVDQLSDLYNRCAAGLVLSYTNMSLLPLELLGCGTIPVVNDAENNRLVSNNPYIAYTQNDPLSLANTLSDIVSRDDSEVYAKKASESTDNFSWQDSGDKFVQAVERELGRHV